MAARSRPISPGPRYTAHPQQCVRIVLIEKQHALIFDLRLIQTSRFFQAWSGAVVRRVITGVRCDRATIAFPRFAPPLATGEQLAQMPMGWRMLFTQ